MVFGPLSLSLSVTIFREVELIALLLLFIDTSHYTALHFTVDYFY